MTNFVHRLENFRPGERDDQPWTAARLGFNATSSTGPFTTVETVTFTDPDDDPTSPKTRNFTTHLAPAPAGWWKVTFLDADASEQPAPPVYFPDPGIRPSVTEVAALLRARTKTKAMGELSTFDDNTRPTGDLVERLIDQALADVTMRVGETVPDELNGSARGVVVLRTAMEIERSYQPEQSTDNFSTFQSLRLSYEEAAGTLVSAVQIRSLFAETSPAEVEA